MEAKLGIIIDESKPDLQKMYSENGNDRKEAVTEENSQDVDGPENKLKITDKDFFNNVSDEEKKFYEESGYNPDDIETMSIQCTACWKQVNHRFTNAIVRHPMLGVPICRSCKNFYGEEDEWTKDEEGYDVFCRWCGNGGDLICCDKCTMSFCKRCIQRNRGRSKVAEIHAVGKWECFSCSPSQIYDIRALSYAIFKWSSSFQMKEQEKSAKKRLDKLKKVREDRMMKIKEAEETNKIDNFIDENISEAFDTLEIYQKCLETEKKKWLKSRKSMNANNAAVTARNLRRIYAITRQNMELLDTALVQAYGGLYPDESQNKLKYGKIPGEAKVPQVDLSGNKTPRSTSKKRKISAVLNFSNAEENEEVQVTSPTKKSVNASSKATASDGEASDNKPKDSVTSGQKPSNKLKGKIKISTNLFKKSPHTAQKKKKKPLLSDGANVEAVSLENSDESDPEIQTKSGRKKENSSSSELDVSFSFE